jgi:hypothetical protein
MKTRPLNEHTLRSTPSSDTEWLMQAGDPPVVDVAHIEAVEAAVNNMSESMQDVIRAIYYEQIPYSELGERLGCSKTQAWRKAKQAEAALRAALEGNTTIMDRYKLYDFDTWDDAAWAIIQSYDQIAPRAGNIELIEWCGSKLVTCVRDGDKFESYMFNSIASECVAELKDRGRWQAGDFHMLLCSKQADYGHNNILAFGLTGVAVRMHDKIARLKNLLNRVALNEPMLDTWYDLIGYSVIAEMLFQDTFTLNLKENQ